MVRIMNHHQIIVPWISPTTFWNCTQELILVKKGHEFPKENNQKLFEAQSKKAIIKLNLKTKFSLDLTSSIGHRFINFLLTTI